jgi:hypothetical protein
VSGPSTVAQRSVPEGDPGAGSGALPPERRRWDPLLVWVLSRVSVVVLTISSAWMLARATAAQVPAFTDLWYRWDAVVFAKIGEFGYLANPRDYPDTGTAAFFPGEPLALRVGHVLTGSWAAAGLLVSLVAGAVASVALARLAAAEHHVEVGSRAVLYLVVSPFAVFLFAGYSEALFLALTLTSWLAARQRRWYLAGLLAGLAGSVRITGAFLGLALVVEWLVDRQGRRWRDLPALALPWLGIAAFSAYMRAITGDWFAYQHVQAQAFGRRLELPWTSFMTTFHAAQNSAQPSAFAWSFGAELLALLVGVALTAVLVVRRSWGEAVYVGGQVVLLATSSFYASVARATLLWWPLWILLAAAGTRHRWVHAAYLAIAVPLAAAGVVAFTQGQWVG